MGWVGWGGWIGSHRSGLVGIMLNQWVGCGVCVAWKEWRQVVVVGVCVWGGCSDFYKTWAERAAAAVVVLAQSCSVQQDPGQEQSRWGHSVLSEDSVYQRVSCRVRTFFGNRSIPPCKSKGLQVNTVPYFAFTVCCFHFQVDLYRFSFEFRASTDCCNAPCMNTSRKKIDKQVIGVYAHFRNYCFFFSSSQPIDCTQTHGLNSHINLTV